MNAWMDAWTNGWEDGCMDAWIGYEQVHGWIFFLYSISLLYSLPLLDHVASPTL